MSLKNIISLGGLLGSVALATIAPAKPIPAGIFRLFSAAVAKPENNPAWTNPNIRGMRLRPAWNNIERAPRVFDWESIDRVVALGAGNSKAIGLSVGAGIFTPAWVYDAGAPKYQLQDNSGLSMPIPWNHSFVTQWSAFVRALGQRYDGNPALGYVVISGLGQNVETYVAQNAADEADLIALGGPGSWEIAAKEIIAVYAEAFPTTPFFITAAKPFKNAAGLAALRNVIQWGAATYPGRFGIMNASLNAASSTIYYPNAAISAYRASQPVGIQMLCSALLDPARLAGTLEQALSRGVALGAHFVEVYQSDGDNPDNQNLLASTNAELSSSLPIQPPKNLHLSQQ